MAAFIKSKITTFVLTGLLALIGLGWIDSYFSFRYCHTASGLDTLMNSDGDIVWKHLSSLASDIDTSVESVQIWSSWGIRFERVSTRDGGYLWQLTISHWLFALLVAVISVPGWLHLGRKRLRSKRRKRGLCPTCGFDLRA